MIQQAITYIDNHLDTDKAKIIVKMIKRVQGCAVESLYKVGYQNEYITSLTCKHKGCNICNYNRQKTIRRKYLLFLERNKELYRIIDEKGREKIIIPEIFNELSNTYLESLEYDLMHLTLTVPHTKDGFNGQKYYYKEFLQLFKKLRRLTFWKDYIFGGEFGVETTRSDNGLNIHSHSLLLVRRFKGNRNYLHRQILLAWNRLTIDRNRKKEPMSEGRVRSIKKGNKTLTDKDIKQLDSRGATLIGLENIFVKTETGKKERQLTDEARIKAVMETVSYHFAPKMFETDNDVFDFDLIAEVLLHTKGMRLYDKFGVLRQSKILNLKNNIHTDFEEAQEVKGPDNYSFRGKFYAISPRRIYHNFDKQEIIIHPSTLRTGRELPAINTTQAIEQLADVGNI